ncbi:MAG: hypothetical protein KA203_03105 [Aquabacterium sp.]|uniref:hypothetical protein n=1 Tax=Aquabacterium sp. TaxID=1872578 RepID=UPI001B5001F0|nr:hypothetical protein [Aquabacterium sp.]MBP6612444.1 hypothetical protein [Aquabacterium sp.]MBP6614695.1 hypothetical protein [Aquabacterium sp.]MBP7133309.1 hypothetical protein [Aquabacterium sp.]MBP9062784.1 hypothetical protein [Aquabacterium sp.]MCC6218889.1 hypothetical protein [Aquabacterium sp.]
MFLGVGDDLLPKNDRIIGNRLRFFAEVNANDFVIRQKVIGLPGGGVRPHQPAQHFGLATQFLDGENRFFPSGCGTGCRVIRSFDQYQKDKIGQQGQQNAQEQGSGDCLEPHSRAPVKQ